MKVTETSYGIIPLRKMGGQWQVFLVQHRAGHWAFPKGHAEPGELPQQAAARELKEETGLSVVSYFCHEPLRENYKFFLQKRRIHKTVFYFMAQVKGRVIIQATEIRQGRWFPLTQAIEQLTFPEGKRLCQQVQHDFLNDLTK